jgi:hypothetical protein
MEPLKYTHNLLTKHIIRKQSLIKLGLMCIYILRVKPFKSLRDEKIIANAAEYEFKGVSKYL